MFTSRRVHDVRCCLYVRLLKNPRIHHDLSTGDLAIDDLCHWMLSFPRHGDSRCSGSCCHHFCEDDEISPPTLTHAF